MGYEASEKKNTIEIKCHGCRNINYTVEKDADHQQPCIAAADIATTISSYKLLTTPGATGLCLLVKF